MYALATYIVGSFSDRYCVMVINRKLASAEVAIVPTSITYILFIVLVFLVKHDLSNGRIVAVAKPR